MNRVILAFLAVLLVLSCAGCGSAPATETAGQTTPTQTEATTDPTEISPTAAPTTPTDPTQMPTTEQTQPATQPTESTQPTQATQPAEPTHPTQATQPTEAPTQATQPTESTQPTQPTQPATQATTPATEDQGCQHSYQQTDTKAATCTAAGSKKFVCSKCGDITRQEIPIKDHSYTQATCLKPKTCSGCGKTEGAALGHNYGDNHLCGRCGVKDPNATPDSTGVNFAVTIRSDEGTPISGITVTVSTGTETKNAVTDKSGKTTVALSTGSSQYTVMLSNVPEGYAVQDSYRFSSTQVTINLKTLPVRSDPNDHSKARYEEGDEMMDFTITDVDGRTYNLAQLRQENKLIILDFWYVSCNPCKNEFPYFEAALEAYGDDIILLAIDPFYSEADIRGLRDEMGLSFPVFQDPLGLSGGFRVESYPTTVFIDSTGTIRKIHRGAFSNEAAFLRAVAAYI